jgi:hypothetical protein
MTRREQMKEYRTSDMYIASALLTDGQTLLKPEKDGFGKITFVFNDEAGEIQRLTEKFWSSELRQPVNVFVNHWRDLRRLISNM